MSNAILDSRVDDGVCILLVRNCLVVSLEEVLVDAKVLVEELQCGFEAFCQRVERISVEALIIHAVNLKDYAHIAGLRQKGVRVNKTVEVHLFVE